MHCNNTGCFIKNEKRNSGVISTLKYYNLVTLTLTENLFLKVNIINDVPQGSTLGPLLYLFLYLYS